MRFDGVIFDMDGVVIDSEVLFDNADTKFFQKYERVYNREEVALLLAGMHLEAATAFLKEKYDLPGSPQELMRERQAFLEAEYKANLRYIVGFEKFHQKAVAASLKTCIATSSNDHLLQIAIDKLGLRSKFGEDIFKASDVANVSKPDPAIYLYAARKIEADPARCMVIEDAPKGIQAAKNAGMYCVGITTTFAADRLGLADQVIASYEEIDLHLERRREN